MTNFANNLELRPIGFNPLYVGKGKLYRLQMSNALHGEVYAFPVGDELSSEDFFVVKLERIDNSENLFKFPDDFNQQEVVVFSGPEAKRRMIPKYYNREAYDFDKQERTVRSSSNTKDWYEALENEDVMMGKHWKDPS